MAENSKCKENCIKPSHNDMQDQIKLRSKGQNNEFGFFSKWSRKQIEVGQEDK